MGCPLLLVTGIVHTASLDAPTTLSMINHDEKHASSLARELTKLSERGPFKCMKSKGIPVFRHDSNMQDGFLRIVILLTGWGRCWT